MKRNFTSLFVAIFSITLTLAQKVVVEPEKRFYLVKNGQVIASYPLTDVDSITFVEPTPILVDIDGNRYEYGNFGGIDFMLSNLKVTRLNDGTAITSGIATGTEPRYVASTPNGYHYNYYVVETEKICPTNWTVPNQEQLNYIFDVAMSETSEPKTVDNLTIFGLNFYTSGYFLFDVNGLQDQSGYYGYWRRDGFSTSNGGHWWANTPNMTFDFGNTNKNNGISIRCIRDRRD